MRARELQEHLRSLDGGWVDPGDTVDTFKAGDPDAEIEGVAVGWMSYTWALERCVDLGCNVFLTHEPTYFTHRDREAPEDLPPWVREEIDEKRAFLAEHDLVVLRCHDLWDQYPGEGIPDSWGARLGFGEPVDGEGYYRVFDVSGRTARDVAEGVAAATRELGQEAVQLVGPADAPVERVAVGTGAITPFPRLVEEYDVDLAICSDDGFTYWRDGALAIDAGVPAIVVNHAVSELDGMARLADHLDDALDVPVRHVEQSCTYELVSAD